MNQPDSHQPLTETEMQQRRYLLGGKGGDGDPPYARDMSFTRSRIEKVMQTSEYQYRWEGD